MCDKSETEGNDRFDAEKIMYLGSDEKIKLSQVDVGRFVFFNSIAAVIAIGSNFLGVTSNIISNTNPTYFESLKIDQLYPITGFQRYIDRDNQYEFVFPQNWIADQNVIISNARQRDLPKSLRERSSYGSQVNIAFAPSGKKEKENVSVLKSQVQPGFTLQGTLGEPREAALRLLSEVLAPESSGKSYELIDAYGDIRNKVPTYTFEYTIKKGDTFYQHCISVITSRGTELYTLTAVVPESRWDISSSFMKRITSSFRFTSTSALPTGFY